VKGVARQQIEVLQGRGSRVAGEKVERVVALGRALSDPIRVRMLGMLAAEAADGRGCCGLPDLGAPVSGGGDSPGICVCEFEECFEMGQSRVSYHMRKLKGAGLVREERRGRWSFYSLDREAARDLLADTGKHLSA
jgi:ArsR family transcriptional regulator, arsenate/arsenite/antimonite-responsive transcriptional repressor